MNILHSPCPEEGLDWWRIFQWGEIKVPLYRYKPWTLEFAYVLNARHPIIEKSGPYCFIGVGYFKNQTPLPIE
jgi:hypothetical protein